jgi:hypothetical protein
MHGAAMKRTILLALLLACGTAQASEWVSLATADKGKTETFVDVSSIRVVGQVRRMWVKFVFAKHSLKGVADDSSKWTSQLVARDAFNCAEESWRRETGRFNYEDGTYRTAEIEAATVPWDPVPPETMADAEMRFICAWKPK